MNRIWVIIIIVSMVVIAGISLNIMTKLGPKYIYAKYHSYNGNGSGREGFAVQTQSQFRDTDGTMTGLVTIKGGAPGEVFKRENGPSHSQLQNVPTATEYIVGRMKKYREYIPLKNVKERFTFGTSDDREIVKKFARGSNPDIVLNPDSRPKNWQMCALPEDCKEYVNRSKLYCPIGMERVQNQTPSGKDGENVYQGCYYVGRRTSTLTSVSDRKARNILDGLKIQRVGQNFLMYPPLKEIQTALQNSVNANEKEYLNLLVSRKVRFIREMAKTLVIAKANEKNMVAIDRWNPLQKVTHVDDGELEKYMTGLLNDAYILVQGQTSETKTRIGYINANKTHIPELKNQKGQSYNLSSIQFLPDTTMDPLPLLA